MTKYYTYNPATRTLSPAPKAVRTPQGIVFANATEYGAIGDFAYCVD